MMYAAHFTMSEAQAEDFPDWETRELKVPLGEFGAQLTYETLRDCESSEFIATFHEGYWIAAVDGREYSDVVIVVDER